MSTHRLRPNRLWWILGAAAVLSACGQIGAPGTVTLLLTDAPGPVNKAVVTIEMIYFQGHEGRTVLRSSPVTTDLITLANDTAELVKDVEVPPGSYSQLRFVISGGYVEVDEGDEGTKIFASSPSYEGLPAGTQVDGTLQMPSYGSSGLKVDIGTVDISSGQHVILIDFDVAQSFGHPAGESKWVMHPVVKGAELTLSGNVLVSLTRDPSSSLPAGVTLNDFKATLTNAGGSTEKLQLADPEGDGSYQANFRYLLPGQFVIDFVGPNGSPPQTDPARPTTVTLGSGESLFRPYVLLGL